MLVTLLALAIGLAAPPPPATAVLPDSQAVFLELDPARPAVAGSTRVWFTLGDSTRTLALESRGLEVSRVALLGPQGAITTAWAAGDAGLRVDVIGGLVPGAYALEIGFDAPWRRSGGWRRGTRTGVRLDTLDVATAFPCAGDSVATAWRLHVQTPLRLRTRSALTLVRRERDREVEVSEWRSEGRVPARALALRAAPRAKR